LLYVLRRNGSMLWLRVAVGVCVTKVGSIGWAVENGGLYAGVPLRMIGIRP
jgi:hypothetical protein